VVALRDRLCEIGTTFAGVDQLAGLPDRYAPGLELGGAEGRRCDGLR
jgi:hypothetical protein